MRGSDRIRDSLEHLHAAQDQLNACIVIAEDAGAARPGGRLANLTVAVKDIIDQKGLPTTCGSGFYRQVPSVSAPVIDRLEGEGAVILARTGLHEFAYGFSNENHWFGPVRNPWDTATSPGGSSGGSAVAVAAGLVDGALGTDTGGSIRVPAAMTGIFGLKVTHGRIPTKGVFPLAPSLDTIGPFARDMSTLSLLYSAMSASEIGSSPTTIDGLRVVVPRTWLDGALLDPVVASAFDDTMSALRSLGAEVVELDLSDMVPWGKIQELVGAEAAHVHRAFRAAGEPYGPEVDARLTVAEAVSAAEYLEAQAWRAHLIETMSEAFSTADLLATPAIAQRRKMIGEEKIGDQHYRPVLSWFSALLNHSGNPAIALPLKGMEPGDGPPPSIQLIAPWWQENLLIGVSSALEEQGVVGFSPPPIFYGEA